MHEAAAGARDGVGHAGARRPHPRTIRKLADALAVEPDELVKGSE